MNPLLDVDNLGKRFGGLVANEGISFRLTEGQIVGLIGPNGAGKRPCSTASPVSIRPRKGRSIFAAPT